MYTATRVQHEDLPHSEDGVAGGRSIVDERRRVIPVLYRCHNQTQVVEIECGVCRGMGKGVSD